MRTSPNGWGGLFNATTLRIEVPEVEAAEATKFLAAPPGMNDDPAFGQQ